MSNRQWRIDRRDITIVETPDERLVAITLTPEDACLIAEAPAMLALLREYRLDHVVLKQGDMCDCNFCREARALFVRVGGEEHA